MKTKLLPILGIAFLLLAFAPLVQAGIWFDFEADPYANSMTINQGDSLNLIMTASSHAYMPVSSEKLEAIQGSKTYPINSWDEPGTTQNGYAYLWTKTYPLNSNVLGAGTFTLNFSAQTSTGLESSTLTLVVNNPPVLATIGNKSVNEGVLLSFVISATDADGDTLTYLLTQKPSWLSINSSTGLITGTAPSVNQDTDYTVSIEVSDGNGGFATQTYTLTVLNVVTGNNDPIITTTAVTQVYENQAYSYDVDATDVDGDTLTYSLTTSPSWLSINSNTGVITGTAPEVSSDTDYSVTVQVSDGNGGFATQTYTLTVKNVVTGNNDPIITTTPITQVYENQDYSYNVDATDADGDTLTYSLTQNPLGFLIDSTTGLITGTAPSVNQDTAYTVSIEVSDGNGGFATQTYTLTVNNNGDKDKKKKTTTYYQSNYEEELYLNQFKSPKIIYLEDDDQPEKVLNWFQKFIEWLKNLFGF